MAGEDPLASPFEIATLESDEACFAFRVTERTVHTWLVLHDVVYYHKTERRPDLDGATASLARAAARSLDSDEDLAGCATLSAELLGALLPKLPESVRTIYVSPDGQINIVPFELLHDAQGLRLFERFAVSYLPSLAWPRASKRSRERRAALFEGNSEALVILSASGVPEEGLASLERYVESSGDLLESIRALVPRGQLHILWDGRKPLGTANDVSVKYTVKLFEKAARTAGITHLFCHGAFIEEDPLDSWIMLGREKLRARELYRVRWPSSYLVVLSACSSGRLAVPAGAEILGFVRPMLAARADTLIVATRIVPARASLDFFTAFYRELQGNGKSQAFVKTQRALLHERRLLPGDVFAWRMYGYTD